MTQSIAPIFQGAYGGLSDDRFSGIANSFQEISNLEVRKSPKQISLNKALVKDSGSVVVDKVNVALTVSSTGDIIAFGDAGNIYIKSLGGTRQKVYTHASGYAILGCTEYDGYIYWATLDKLHRTDLSSIDTAISGGTLTPTDLDRQTLNGITYSNGLATSYTLDASTKVKTGMKIYAKKEYELGAVGVSDGTTAATKGYLEEATPIVSIAGSSLRLYTSAEIDPLDGTPAWTERQPIDDNDYDWRTTATDRTGTVMLAGVYGARLYLSTNSGVSRAETQPAGATDQNWNAAAISNDGTKMIASTDDKRVRFSTNSGTSWTECQPSGDIDDTRHTVAISGDGSLYGVSNNTDVYTSPDGTTWTSKKTTNPTYDWCTSITINTDATKILLTTTAERVSHCTSGHVYYSGNSGTSFSDLTPFGRSYPSGSMSDNGSAIIVHSHDCSDVHKCLASIDYGATFYDTSMTGTPSSVSVDHMGLRFVVSNGTRVYTSVDGANNRSELQPAGDNDKVWKNVAIGPGAIPIEDVTISGNVATFSSTLSADTYYYITFDKEGSSWDASYKVASLPAVKTDINYINGINGTANTTTHYVITSIGSTVVNDIAHPMITSNGNLYIGDGQYVATVDNLGTYEGEAVILAETEKIYDMSYNNSYIRMYCIKGTNTDTGIAYFWDGITEAPDQRQELPGKFRNTASRDNIDYAIMGSVDPILYYYPYQRQILKRIDNLSSGIKSMINYKNYLLFGCVGGVYSRGNFNKDYPEALTLEYKTSNNNTTDTIGCIWNANGDLYVSWKDGTNYGIDKLSTTTYAPTGFLTTRVFSGDMMWKNKRSIVLYVTHKPLITGESIQIYTRKDLTGDWTLQYTIDSTKGAGTYNEFPMIVEFRELEVKTVLNGPGTSTPEVYETLLRYDQLDG